MIAFALEYDLKAEQATQSHYALTINSAIASSTSYNYLNKTGFT